MEQALSLVANNALAAAIIGLLLVVIKAQHSTLLTTKTTEATMKTNQEQLQMRIDQLEEKVSHLEQSLSNKDAALDQVLQRNRKLQDENTDLRSQLAAK